MTKQRFLRIVKVSSLARVLNGPTASVLTVGLLAELQESFCAEDILRDGDCDRRILEYLVDMLEVQRYRISGQQSRGKSLCVIPSYFSVGEYSLLAALASWYPLLWLLLRLGIPSSNGLG
ncbi:hypothetical protein KQX54_006691 [Cotesia glomerata]|uniref:Uncharacterized protein n=1 Tax=Cotesia glomerata TaxID=32391 RepID=A0AAV7IXX3_COTGL|nr:hypothetical protein KQX54_006691 [Cotesia glomerata]